MCGVQSRSFPKTFHPALCHTDPARGGQSVGFESLEQVNVEDERIGLRTPSPPDRVAALVQHDRDPVALHGFAPDGTGERRSQRATKMKTHATLFLHS